MTRWRPRDYPKVYERMLQTQAGLDELPAAELANPYKRASLRHAFNAGWLAAICGVQLGAGVSDPNLSRLGRAAMLRGHQARAGLDPTTNGGPQT